MPISAARFPIVALGASAGGLDAIRRILGAVAPDIGVAFVVVQHLDPERPSMLANVLSGATRLPVVEAASGMTVVPDRVYVIPSGSDLSIQDGILTLEPRRVTGRLHLPIDSFFRALAGDRRRQAIGVVLSGSGADGTEGLRAIKGEGGIALVQSPESAQFRSMPESALGAGVVDFAGPPEELAREILRLSRHAYVAEPVAADKEEKADDPADKDVDGILAIVRRASGVDFGGYRYTTIKRRIERRMALRHVASLHEYADALVQDGAEARAMAKDMLIHVTAFFRDPEAFAALEQHVFRSMATDKRVPSSIRIWVPGCSTGEEVYSVAICLLEALDDRARSFSIKIFGSDLTEEAVETARAGVYSEAALTDVSPERLLRFFDRVEGGYRIGKRIRDLCVFVRHDLTRDPPFAKLDLVCCRNVLIYFDVDLQRRVVPMLHYCLGEPGFLFLGQSEAIAGFRDLFRPLDKEHRIFAKRGEGRNAYALAAYGDHEISVARPRIDRQFPTREAQRQADHLLLARFAPPGVLVNESLEILQFRGRTGAFLESPPGLPDSNILRMAREGLSSRLHEALEQAMAQSVTVIQRNLRLDTDGVTRFFDLEVVPLLGVSGAPERFFLVLFHDLAPGVEAHPGPREPPGTAVPPDVEEVTRLRAELLATREYLQSLVRDHQATADDLAGVNEELIAANEELQSTNEELQSAKEELQSTNEELSTLNEELRNRNDELDQIASDLENVLASVDIPVIIVDMALRVRRFTPTMHKIATFIPEDVGRPIDDLRLKVKVDDVPERILGVIHDLVAKEWDVEGPEGRWYRMQIRPYRTTDRRLDGAVLAFLDVDRLKRAVKDAESARDYAKSIVETVTTALMVIDGDLKVVSSNQAFYRLFGLSASEVEGASFVGIGGGWEGLDVRGGIADAAARRVPFYGMEISVELPGIGRKILSLSGRPILWGGGAAMTLIAIDDISGIRALEQERAQLLDSEKQARIEAERANRAKDLFLATLSHELRTPLNIILLEAQLLGRLGGENPTLGRASTAIERAARTQARLIDDLLDVSRIVAGKLLLDLRATELKEIVQSAVDMAMIAAEAKGVELRLSAADDFLAPIYGDAMRLHQVVTNLLSNAIKFTPRGGRISIRLDRTDERAEIAITDTGIGIRADVLPHLFSRFVQGDSSVTRIHGGLGLGLAIVRHLVEAHGGEVHAESPGERMGTTLRVSLPIGAAGAHGTTDDVFASIAHEIRGVRVLLVEDDDDARASFLAMLELLGAVVSAVPSAAAGLAMIETFRPQVILSDIAMPEEDGYCFIRKVRRLAPGRGGLVPAGALTALAGDDDRRQAKEAGFQLHIAKPVEAVHLAAAVRTLAAMTLRA